MGNHGKVVRLIAALASLMPAIAGAGTVIETDGGAGGASSTLYVTDSKVRVENTGRPRTVTLFDRNANELIFIDHSTRQYQRVGQEEMRQIAARMDRTREQMKERIEEMPPEKRARMRERLKEMPSGDGSSAIRIERRESDTTAGISCQEAMVHLNDEPSHLVCAASARNIGLSQGAFRTVSEMFAFFGEMTSGMSEGKAELGPRTTSTVIRELGALPVRSEAVESESTWSVTAVRETTLPPERFRVPSEYSEVDPLAQTPP